jgi:hypothetical protein
MSKSLVLVAVLAFGVFAAHPASAHGLFSSSVGGLTNYIKTFFTLAASPSNTVGSPSPLLASGIPSLIVLAAAAFFARRRNG